MRIYDIIEKKRDGRKLDNEEIRFFVDGYAAGAIPDYQAAALLMAIFLRGMDDEETRQLTLHMMRSGDTVDLSGLPGITVDKHSTGGVGDKTSLAVVPILAAMDPGNIFVAKMSGRGLGHTGGTIDKLESIPGFNVNIAGDDFVHLVRDHGGAIVGQTGNLVPADKRIYALRDVTATVDSIPLIASSIMSKKLASGSNCILLDVKVGSGAFMKTVPAAVELAQSMVAIGCGAGRRVEALITNMDRPLGRRYATWTGAERPYARMPDAHVSSGSAHRPLHARRCRSAGPRSSCMRSRARQARRDRHGSRRQRCVYPRPEPL